MRSVLRRVASIVRAAMASVAHVVLLPIRMVDGTICWVIKAMQPPAATDFEDVGEVAPAAPQPQAALSVDDRHREVGLAVQAMVKAYIAYRKIPENEVGYWLRTLSAPALHAIATSDPVAVGRHLAGLETLRTEHNIRIPLPDALGDRRKVQRRFAEIRARARQDEADRKAERRWQDPEIAHRLIPSLGV